MSDLKALPELNNLKTPAPRAKRREAEKICPRHGAYRSLSLMEGIWSPCPGCEEEEREAERARQARHGRSLEQAARLIRAGVPPRFRQAAFDNFLAESPAQREAREAAAAYAADFAEARRLGRCLAFVGAVGAGKSHLAVAVIRRISAAGFSARLSTVGDYFREIKDHSWGPGRDRRESEILAEYAAPDLLVLDEVGVQYGTPAEENLLFTLFNKRYNELKPILVISNEDPEGLCKFLGERSFDRLRENGGLIIPFNWKSFRGRREEGREKRHC